MNGNSNKSVTEEDRLTKETPYYTGTVTVKEHKTVCCISAISLWFWHVVAEFDPEIDLMSCKRFTTRTFSGRDFHHRNKVASTFCTFT
jgi:hypothetical protein